MKATFGNPGILLGLLATLGLAVSLPGATNFVRVRGFSFSPKDLTVAVGDTVVFSGGNNEHTVTGDGAEPFCGAGFFTTCSVTFSTEGTFAYHCIPHFGLGMTGVVHAVTVVTSPLTIMIHGQGMVSPDLNGQSLIVGNTYTVTATPVAGFVFNGWTGGQTSSAPQLTFVMQPNLVLEANFVFNPLPSASGNYNGLFFVEDGVRHESSGAFTFRLMSSGIYSGQTQLAGKRLPFKGQFDFDGRATNTVRQAGTNNLSMELMLDVSNGSDEISGRVIDPSAGWTAKLTGDRAPVFANGNASPYSGSYTLLVTKSDETNEDLGIGTGFGTLKIDAKGKVKLSGILADGTPVAQSVPVSKAGQWPLYAALYGGKGSILSWVSVSTNAAPEASLQGELSWIKPTLPRARYYASGFTNEMEMVGSIYQPPRGTKVLPSDRASISFQGGNLTSALTNIVRLESNNKVTNLTSNRALTLSIALPTGLFTGSLKANDGAIKTLKFKGAVLQRQNLGAGFFLGTNESGSVGLEPLP